ncbi:MAG: beta-galactosidase, partial [Clostridia bacterium]|nr:beta-galactosidase [Clostridia bacterium]
LTPLRGVSRHQDMGGKGNALSPADHRRDAELIAEVGANAVRLAHYQHAEEFYSLCDECGFIVWAEIPFISRMDPDPEAHENCISQLRELIIQCYNHPSVCFWGIANEITIGGGSEQLEKNLRELDALVKKLDPHRISTIAQVSMLPMESPLNGITDVIAYNHYFGWYGGEFSDNERWFDGFHEKYPDRAIGISEYGCEGIIAYHGDKPKMGDYSEEYQALYHEHMLELLENRPWIWGSYVWNMFDFGCDARDEGGVKGRNNKGLVTIDRRIKKDAFYLYKAYWSSEPTVHICGKRYYARKGEISVKVYTNLPKVALFLDGEAVGERSGGRVLTFENIRLHGGMNRITAVADGMEDCAFFECVEELPQWFTLPADTEEKGVTNWFEGREMADGGEMTFKDGYFSVRDTVRAVLENERSAKMLTDVLSSVSGMALKPSMLMMMADQTVEGLLTGDLAAAKLGDGAEKILATVNAELQKIPK